MDERVSRGLGCQRGAKRERNQEIRAELGGKEKLRQPRKQRARRATNERCHREVIYDLTHGRRGWNTDDRHAGMDCRHPGSQDAPETSMSAWVPAPCWNDATKRFCLNRPCPQHPIFTRSRITRREMKKQVNLGENN